MTDQQPSQQWAYEDEAKAFDEADFDLSKMRRADVHVGKEPKSSLAVPQPVRRATSRKATIVMLAGCALVAVGSFLPWVKVSIIFGTLSKDGIEGDGKVTLVVAAVIAAAVYTGLNRALHVTQKVAVLLLGLFLVGISVFEFADTSHRFQRLQASDIAHLSYGPGLYIVLAGAMAICVGALLSFTRGYDR